MTEAMTRALELHQPIGVTRTSSEAEFEAYRKTNRLRQSLNDDDWPKKIKAFRDLYGLSKFDNSSFGPLSPLREMLHRGLFAEEAGETIFQDGKEPVERSLTKAFIHQARDLTPEQNEMRWNYLVEVVDGILDTVVVGLGWLAELGLSPQRINLLMEEVHASNMTKVDNSGQPVYDSNGKVLKGDNYVKADIIGLLRQFIAEDTAKEQSHG